MPEPPAKLHHVVYCMHPEHQDAAADVWRSVGVTFTEIPLAAEGLRVLLDWDAGIEIVSPTAMGGTESERFRAFLAEHGEGVFSVVVLVPDVAGPIAALDAHGASVRFEQHRDLGDHYVDEADLRPVRGMAITLLATNLP